MKRLLFVFVGVAIVCGASLKATMIWDQFAGPTIAEYGEGAAAACPEDGYPESGQPLTACQEGYVSQQG